MREMAGLAGALLFVLVGCASSSEPAAKPTTCKKTDRHGVYLTEFRKISGDCGEIPTSLIDIDNKAATAGCMYETEVWTQNDCKLSSSSTCVSAKDKVTTKITGTITQETQDGSVMSGPVTFSLSGNTTCLGTYSVTYTRQ